MKLTKKQDILNTIDLVEQKCKQLFNVSYRGDIPGFTWEKSIINENGDTLSCNSSEYLNNSNIVKISCNKGILEKAYCTYDNDNLNVFAEFSNQNSNIGWDWLVPLDADYITYIDKYASEMRPDVVNGEANKGIKTLDIIGRKKKEIYYVKFTFTEVLHMDLDSG